MKRNIRTIIIVVILLALLIGAYFFVQNLKTDNKEEIQKTPAEKNAPEIPEQQPEKPPQPQIAGKVSPWDYSKRKNLPASLNKRAQRARSGILVDLEMCKYLRTLAILIANHVEIIRTVRIAGRIISNPVVSEEFDGIDRKLKSGEKLSAAFSGNQYIPAGTVPMLRVGEESGTVGEMLGNIAGNLEADTRLRIKRLLSLFEPAVIVFLAAIVLVVVVSIFVAMMEINSISQGGPKL